MQNPLERIEQGVIAHAEPLTILMDACSQALSLLQGEKEFNEDLTIYGPGGMNVVRIQRVLKILEEALSSSLSLTGAVAND